MKLILLHAMKLEDKNPTFFSNYTRNRNIMMAKHNQLAKQNIWQCRQMNSLCFSYNSEHWASQYGYYGTLGWSI